MVEVDLEELEDFYNNKLNALYSKIKKAVKKLVQEIETGLNELRRSVEHFQDAGSERKIGEKALRSLNFFTDRITKEIDEIEIPGDDEIYYENLIALLNSNKKLFQTINDIAKKSLPKFKNEVQPQIKELEYLSRKLRKRLSIFDEFLRKRYGDVRSAEELIKKKIPKLFTLKENIEHSKVDLDAFEEELEERRKNQELLNSELMELEKNPLFKELEMEKNRLFQLKIKINNQLSFKKALKKMKVELERETLHVPGVNINYLRDFLKNPIRVLSSDSKDLAKFSSLLIKLRHALEENKLNLKSDKKDKTIEHINTIFEDKVLHSEIEKVNAIKSKIKEIEARISKAGLADQLEEVKSKISLNTAKIEHLENDKNKKNSDYMRYLASLKNEREELQKLIEEALGEHVKINITFSF